MTPGGFNPLRWDCKGRGCFNKQRRPKIEFFADCFPGRISFGDVDGEVEINGRFLQLEWKGEGGSVKTGQRRKFEAYTRNPGWGVLVVEGDAANMAVRRYCLFWRGKQLPWQAADLDAVKAVVRRWVSSTSQNVAA